jgi:chemotaxis protein methyltransferase CheR
MTPQGFAAIAESLRQCSGLAIGPDKIYLLESRLAPLLRRQGLRDLDALAMRLAAGGAQDLARAVAEAMTTNESSFFRDEKPFADVRQHALPQLHANRPPGARLRIWSAAASTGQEAYSLAMIVAELRSELAGREVEILGTDLARAPLARAREGLYTNFEVQRGLSPALLARHFRREGERWRIADTLRAMVRFEVWNLLDDLRPLGRFDIVFCRNVLLYFDRATRARVLAAIARQMAPDGLLYLGGAETMLGVSDRFVSLAREGGAHALAPPASAPALAATR